MDIKRTKSEDWIILLNTNNPRQSSSSYAKTYLWKTNSKINIPGNIKRNIINTLFQLKINHGYFKLYLQRFGISANNKCRYRKRETLDHLLLNCPLYKKAKRKLKENNPSFKFTIKYLLHTKTGIIKTLEFIDTTRIAIRL
ncbi:hypothetical protein OCU04_008531 [Sclerotinia nivalis]|uniref:Reverse transcriptase zinc-binding domain-containing protein n=1 Tax=Sclerotinia nivalis TaxID=352851 RepID=A0A9X0DH37_9HELO|nr:hypothetical protein OCU04_008531 [Sclerotinia nivalis]